MQTGRDVNRRCGGEEAWTKGATCLSESLGSYSVSPWDAVGRGAEGAGGLFLYTEAATSETSETEVCFCIYLRQDLAV